MAQPILIQDQADLRRALAALAQEGVAPKQPAEGRQRVSGAMAMLPDMGIDQDSASFELFRALSKSPLALKRVLERLDPARLDDSMALCAQASGVDISAIPEWLGVGGARSGRTMFHYTPLQWCAFFDLWREARLLLAFGAQPALFNAEVTAVGLAAYAGSARVLAEMSSFGADLLLFLSPEHVPNAPSSAGSTLLHRVAERSASNPAARLACARVLALSERCYPDLLCQTLDGKTVLDWAIDDAFKNVVLSCVAEREARSLSKQAPTTLKNKSKPRL